MHTKKQKRAIEWNRVTWYSKLVAVVVFLATFFIAFNLGILWEQARIATAFLATPTPIKSHAPSTGTLTVGASATVRGTPITILGLTEYSRCPVDVQCIQAGTVRVRASIGAYNRDFIFTLGEPQTVGNVIITLASVIPAQRFAQQAVRATDYYFTFTVVPAAQ